MARLFQSKAENDYYMIPNGFDDTDFHDILPDQQNTMFRIAHTGHLADNQNPIVLWEAIAQLLDQEPRLKEVLKLEFYGGVHHKVIETLKSFGLEKYTTFYDYQSHDKILRVMKSASLLLFVVSICSYSEGILTGKLFEYLGAQQPILGIGPIDGDAAVILEETQTGKMINYEDTDAAIEYIQEIYCQWASSTENNQKQVKLVQTYTRRNLAQKLSVIFNRLNLNNKKRSI